ncbi:UNVERIFIED_CONTAM: MAG2-interacting protein 2 [Sesamum radiatum]|uniref:MAG2-interacting protein 2 n=1 Tax=Sesamum radiatum TaxID=300843 RepID=A0AAW2KDW1_SESRA
MIYLCSGPEAISFFLDAHADEKGVKQILRLLLSNLSAGNQHGQITIGQTCGVICNLFKKRHSFLDLEYMLIEFCRGLLKAGKFSLARNYLKGTSSVALATDKAENLVIQAAREYFSQHQLLLALSRNVRVEADIIDAITVRLPSLGVNLLPMAFRQIKDPMEIIKLAITSQSGAYLNVEELIEIAKLLGLSSQEDISTVQEAIAREAAYAGDVQLAFDLCLVLAKKGHGSVWDLCAALARSQALENMHSKSQKLLLGFALSHCDEESIGELLHEWKDLDLQDHCETLIMLTGREPAEFSEQNSSNPGEFSGRIGFNSEDQEPQVTKAKSLLSLVASENGYDWGTLLSENGKVVSFAASQLPWLLKLSEDADFGKRLTDAFHGAEIIEEQLKITENYREFSSLMNMGMLYSLLHSYGIECKNPAQRRELLLSKFQEKHKTQSSVKMEKKQILNDALILAHTYGLDRSKVLLYYLNAILVSEVWSVDDIVEEISDFKQEILAYAGEVIKSISSSVYPAINGHDKQRLTFLYDLLCDCYMKLEESKELPFATDRNLVQKGTIEMETHFQSSEEVYSFINEIEQKLRTFPCDSSGKECLVKLINFWLRLMNDMEELVSLDISGESTVATGSLLITTIENTSVNIQDLPKLYLSILETILQELDSGSLGRQSLHRLLSSLSKLEGDLEDLKKVRSSVWERMSTFSGNLQLPSHLRVYALELMQFISGRRKNLDGFSSEGLADLLPWEGWDDLKNTIANQDMSEDSTAEDVSSRFTSTLVALKSSQLVSSISPSLEITPEDIVSVDSAVSSFLRVSEAATTTSHVGALLAMLAEWEGLFTTGKDENAPVEVSDAVNNSWSNDNWDEGWESFQEEPIEKETKESNTLSIHPLHICWMTLIRKLVTFSSHRDVLKLLDRNAGKNSGVLLDEDDTRDLTQTALEADCFLALKIALLLPYEAIQLQCLDAVEKKLKEGGVPDNIAQDHFMFVVIFIEAQASTAKHVAATGGEKNTENLDFLFAKLLFPCFITELVKADQHILAGFLVTRFMHTNASLSLINISEPSLRKYLEIQFQELQERQPWENMSFCEPLLNTVTNLRDKLGNLIQSALSLIPADIR